MVIEDMEKNKGKRTETIGVGLFAIFDSQGR